MGAGKPETDSGRADCRHSLCAKQNHHRHQDCEEQTRSRSGHGRCRLECEAARRYHGQAARHDYPNAFCSATDWISTAIAISNGWQRSNGKRASRSKGNAAISGSGGISAVRTRMSLIKRLAPLSRCVSISGLCTAL